MRNFRDRTDWLSLGLTLIIVGVGSALTWSTIVGVLLAVAGVALMFAAQRPGAASPPPPTRRD